MNDVEIFWFNGKIKFIPVNGFCSDLIFYNEFILWGTAGKFTGLDYQCTSIIQYTFTNAKCILY